MSHLKQTSRPNYI